MSQVCGMAGAAGRCPFAFHSESRRLCRKWFEGHESGTPPYYVQSWSWISTSSLLHIFCMCNCHWRVWDVGRKWFEEVGRRRRPSPPPFPSAPSACIARRRSQLLLGMDVLILWPSGASDNCRLSSQNLRGQKRPRTRLYQLMLPTLTHNL